MYHFKSLLRKDLFLDNGLTYLNFIYLLGRFLYHIHLDRWTIRILFWDSSTRLTPLGFHQITHLLPWKGESSLSLFSALLSGHSDCLSLNTDWHGICCSCTIAATVPYWLLFLWLCCFHQPGLHSCLCPIKWNCHTRFLLLVLNVCMYVCDFLWAQLLSAVKNILEEAIWGKRITFFTRMYSSSMNLNLSELVKSY